ncbi:MAG: hypothetical protein R3245_08215, partial [Kiloniellales bacterium]|nr:hypothetical protein [Kiloniellales bacterium]
MDSNSVKSFTGWTPIAFRGGPKGTEVEWVNLGEADFSEPFFFETIEKHLVESEGKIAISPPEVLGLLPHISPCLAPTAFIFHASRCGSTLLANLLKVPDANMVLSEPRPLNQLLGSSLRRSAPEIWLQLFQATIVCLGQPRRQEQRHYFTKFSSHAVFRFPDIAKAFPKVP